MSKIAKFTTLSLLFSSQITFAEGAHEALLGYQPDPKGISYQVKSNGCTDRNSFVVEISRDKKITEVALVRIKPDLCRVFMPMGVSVSYTYDETGIQPSERFIVTNPNGAGYGYIW